MDPFGYRMSPPCDVPVTIRPARREHGRAQSATQPAMAGDQEERFLPRLPFREGNNEAVLRIPASLIEGSDELLSYRNEVQIRERIALSSSLKRQLSNSQVLPEWRCIPTGSTQTGCPLRLLV